VVDINISLLHQENIGVKELFTQAIKVYFDHQLDLENDEFI
jgi:hypothetical protein